MFDHYEKAQQDKNPPTMAAAETVTAGVTDETEFPDWSAFTVPAAEEVPFASHAATTELYEIAMAQRDRDRSLTMGFTDSLELFNTSRSLSQALLANRTTDDLIPAYSTAFASLFSSDSSDEHTSKAIIHALRLANTQPSIFAFNFKTTATAGSFSFDSLGASTLAPDVRPQRHDIAQWIACFRLLGKTFSHPTWNSAYATMVTAPIAGDAVVAKVTFGSDTFDVTKDELQTMKEAVEAIRSTPTLYQKLWIVMTSVSKILRVSLLEYTFPESSDVLEAFDWNFVIPGRKDTYPKAVTPTVTEYERVRTIHRLVKEDKDKGIRTTQFGNSGVQAYGTFRQKWQLWRELHAVVRYIERNGTRQMVYDLCNVELKNATSSEAMWTIIHKLVDAHITKLKRESKKRERAEKADEDLLKLQQEEEKSRKEAARLKAQEKRISKEVQALEKDPGISADRRSSRNATAAARKKNEEAIKQKKAEAQATKKKQQEALDLANKMKREQAILAASRDKVAMPPPPKESAGHEGRWTVEEDCQVKERH